MTKGDKYETSKKILAETCAPLKNEKHMEITKTNLSEKN